MAGKVKKFRAKPRKGAKKRFKPSGAKDSSETKLQTKRINNAHRLIGKSRERKLKAAKPTIISKVHQKFKELFR